MVEVSYVYKARIIETVDGDTIHAEVDTGFDSWEKKTLRLYGIDAPETGTQAGKDAQSYARSILIPGLLVLIQTVKDRREKYGRYLATIFLSDGTNFNELMVSSGHAVPYLP